MDSIDDDDVERIERDYVDPNATRQQAIQAALADAGIDGNSNDAFSQLMVTADDVRDSVDTSVGSGKREIATREDVERALERTGKPRSGTRDAALVDEVAREMGAPSESALQAARGRALRNADVSGDTATLRTDPSLDPLASGGEGREVEGDLQSLTTGVEATGSGKGTYYAEDASGNRYPLAEVDL